MTPDLKRLAGLYGFNSTYWDARGELHELSEPTLRRLLCSLGVIESIDASDDAIGRAVHEERVALWRPGLPPVKVLYEGEPGSIDLVIAEDQAESIWHFSIATECDRQLTGTFEPATLEPTGDPDDRQGWTCARCTTIDGITYRRYRWRLPELPLGYHRLRLQPPVESPAKQLAAQRTTRLIVAPRRCYQPQVRNAGNGHAHSDRLWGTACQLYAVPSTRNWGMGDFSDLATMMEQAATLGADIVGVNPLHVLFAHAPEEASPYSPSSRLFLNPLYIDVQAVDGFAEAGFVETLPDPRVLESLRSSSTVDYTSVSQCKMSMLETLFEAFCKRHPPTGSDERRRAFNAFCTAGGIALQRFARFEALREMRHAEKPTENNDWHTWPAELRDRDSAAVEQFAKAHASRVEFYTWLQWQASEQLQHAAHKGQQCGLKVGLYRDLAVGVAAHGADVWANPALFVDDVHVGAPPDEFSPNGQDWGLPPFNPATLQQSGYQVFIDILRSNMQAAGALRIDHVMGMMRLFWIPAGEIPSIGAYVDYPLEDLLAIVALESQRQECIVIGEDLGTVPEGLRERLTAAGVLSYRLLYFEKHYETDQRFRSPESYPEAALVSATTHDLPTLRGFWNGADIALREQLGLFPSEELRTQQLEGRAADRKRLLQALADEGLWPADSVSAEAIPMDDDLIEALHVFLARSPARLLLVNLEDLLGQVEQVNLPGTDRDRHPNWRRKLPLTIEQWLEHAPLRHTASAIASARNCTANR